MLVDTLDNGVTKESLSRAFKVDTRLIDVEDVTELSRFFPGDTLDGVNEAAKSFKDKFPLFFEIQDEFGFSEKGEVTEVQIDGFLDKLEQFRDPPIPQIPQLLTKHCTWPLRRIGGCPEIRNRFS